MSAPPVSLVETLQERYRIERELGRGGMATVWLAQDRAAVGLRRQSATE